jgi:hypothetical protein
MFAEKSQRNRRGRPCKPDVSFTQGCFVSQSPSSAHWFRCPGETSLGVYFHTKCASKKRRGIVLVQDVPPDFVYGPVPYLAFGV